MSGIVHHAEHLVTHPFEPILHPKKFVKGEVKTIAKNWKPILMAAAIVFTAGIATVGVAGFAAASASAGGGFAGFMAAAGSTFVAGAGAIGATVGIGSGASAGGAAAAGTAGSVTGSGILTGGTYVGGTGALAASGTGAGLGMSAANAAYLSGAAATGSLAPTAGAAFAGLPTASDTAGLMSASNATPTAVQNGLASHSASPFQNGLASHSASPFPASSGPRVDIPGENGFTGNALSGTSPPTTAVAPKASVSKGLGKFMNSKLAGPLVLAGMQGMQGIAQRKAQEAQYQRTRPLGYWGVGVRGSAGLSAPVTSPFAPGETLANTGPAGAGMPTQPNGIAQGPVFGAEPNGHVLRQSAPNGAQGLMTLAWNMQTGQPYNPANPADPNNPYGYRYAPHA